jgi:hypothetical protein
MNFSEDFKVLEAVEATSNPGGLVETITEHIKRNTWNAVKREIGLFGIVEQCESKNQRK